MGTPIEAGSRLRSTTCTTEVMVVRVADPDAVLSCGGHPMRPSSEPAGDGAEVLAPFDGGSQIGKRYHDEAAGLEVLCTKAGAGSLSVDGRTLPAREAKPLPASD